MPRSQFPAHSPSGHGIGDCWCMLPQDPTAPPRDLPNGGFAVIRSVGDLVRWQGYVWEWTGRQWTPAPDPSPIPPSVADHDGKEQ